MQDLIEAYMLTRRHLRASRTLNTDRGERQVIGEMISDCEYTIEWLRTGRRPETKRGIERPYRVAVWDPDWFEYYRSPSGTIFQRDESIRKLSKEDRFRIDEAMHDLSERERQCFLMHHVDLMSLEEIGLELHIGKSTVQSYIDRANQKIAAAKMDNMFLM